jgi:Protein of unknown function (DUF2510)
MTNGGMQPAGWHPDPTGRNELRYWDGATWTEYASTAGQQRTDPVAGPPGATATATATTPTYTPTAPGPMPPVRAHKVWPWVVGGIALVMVVPLVVILAVASLGNNVNDKFDKAGEQLSATATSPGADDSITKEQFDAVTIGTSRADVITQLGKQPYSDMSDCIYYHRSDGGASDRSQFCFTNDALSIKRWL